MHLVEMRDELAPDANVRHRPLLLAEVDKYVTVHTGLRGLRVTWEGVVCADRDGHELLVPGTSVICALGQRSRTETVTALQDTAPLCGSLEMRRKYPLLPMLCTGAIMLR